MQSMHWLATAAARLTFAIALLASAILPIQSAPVVHAGGQFLQWDEQGRTFKSFGANSQIVIYTGAIDYIGPPMQTCPGGVPDEIYPYSDVYVVPSGSVSDGAQLNDVAGQPNTIWGAHGGIFIGEMIGIAAPSGKIGGGTYAVVYD